ncbi:ureidoglycolate lyase (plasmid) [Cupriavidus necator N-1]|jgi:2-keto-4-pentenoate hydratase/2-oxohepta-3-ene-1,7-dioic acid hydratase in catechol pathway|uniref:Ureidoglycolate lyase n=1 Tax=Cupriavidus necator (strain ATCC 43291 / DSM 13513 / CCUG 52238 / LMG 8453 / N-1) TaxID=1042878 RepID=F8GV65_CUPNN|nr:fumarylacetoacetate hydrolase family protein [Cupriavidus necator]AEI82565.1 ureidoglycolate lyase [Cupriavidus necator N-1]MDX6007564.1 fumarylacetoacetate hydrolase family protein [Cupriavidus necator]
MKLIRYGAAGQERPGMVDAQGRIRDLSAHIPDVTGDTISPQSVARLAAIDPATLPLVEGSPRVGPCVGAVGKMVCVGLNYSDHAAESNMAIPTEPVLFMKATSAIVGPNDDVEIPPRAEKVDWEVELGVVIGKTARYVSKADALDHVAGYCIVNDVSERAYQLERGGQWDKGKSCDTFGPLGPWLVTRDEVPDAQALALWLEVDGKSYQNGNTSTMIFDVPTLVSYISQFMSLQPGDVISTGTPPGVGFGQKPVPVYLGAGQVMRLGITGLGEQRQRTVPANVEGAQ